MGATIQYNDDSEDDNNFSIILSPASSSDNEYEYELKSLEKLKSENSLCKLLSRVMQIISINQKVCNLVGAKKNLLLFMKFFFIENCFKIFHS